MNQLALHTFRLYIAGNGPNSSQARTNLAALCHTYLPDRHQIEIIDVYKEPKRALADRIFMTPTLVRMAPAPVLAIVGSLSDTQRVLQALGMETPPT